jgi:hypothetical protein
VVTFREEKVDALGSFGVFIVGIVAQYFKTLPVKKFFRPPFTVLALFPAWAICCMYRLMISMRSKVASMRRRMIFRCSTVALRMSFLAAVISHSQCESDLASVSVPFQVILRTQPSQVEPFVWKVTVIGAPGLLLRRIHKDGK